MRSPGSTPSAISACASCLRARFAIAIGVAVNVAFDTARHDFGIAEMPRGVTSNNDDTSSGTSIIWPSQAATSWAKSSRVLEVRFGDYSRVASRAFSRARIALSRPAGADITISA